MRFPTQYPRLHRPPITQTLTQHTKRRIAPPLRRLPPRRLTKRRMNEIHPKPQHPGPTTIGHHQRVVHRNPTAEDRAPSPLKLKALDAKTAYTPDATQGPEGYSVGEASAAPAHIRRPFGKVKAAMVRSLSRRDKVTHTADIRLFR